MVRQNAVNTKEQTLQQADEMTVTVNTNIGHSFSDVFF